MTRLLLAVDVHDPALGEAVAGLGDYLRAAGWELHQHIGPLASAEADAVVVVSDVAPDQAVVAALGSTPTLLLGPTLQAWHRSPGVPEASGVVLAELAPRHETRVRPGADAAGLLARVAGDVVLSDRWPLVEKVVDDVEVLLTANVRLVDHPVATLRRATSVATLTLGSDPAVVADPAYRRLVHRVCRRLLGLPDGPDVRVGLLGYGAIGSEHDAAVAAVHGLRLTAVCDRNPSRVAAALARTPDARAQSDGESLLAADDVDVVIVSTPPSSHAEWALSALRAGKHVVVEKPFCLTVAEADAVLAAAADADRSVVVYQNRRWDRDFVALRRIVRSGAIGELFHVESFVGGYGHPCNYWHSDEGVSGGAIYDWGSHYLDWLLELFPQQVEWVSATAHKRVWHDVSNADHTRVLVHFVDGAEAEFTHSDLAAALKPKWYALGTTGAVRGTWRQASVLSRDGVGNLAEDTLAAAESPAVLTVFRPDGDGGVAEEQVPLPPPEAQPFHRELADRLITGEPMSVSAAQSRRGVSVMEAATASARADGRPVTPNA